MKRTIIKAVALILAAICCFALASCSFKDTGEEQTTEPKLPSKTELPSAEEDALAYFNKLMKDLTDGKYAVNYSTQYKPGGFSCENCPELAAALPTIVKLMNFNDGLGGEVAADDAAGLSDFIANVLPVKGEAAALELTLEDVAKDENGKYKISVNAEQFEQQSEEESRAAADSNYEAKDIDTDPDVRVITITLKDEKDPQTGESLFGKIFDLPDRSKIEKEFKKCESYLRMTGGYEADYSECTVRMEIDRLTDEVKVLEFGRGIDVKVNVRGEGTLESVGDQTICFRVGGADRYEFTRETPEDK